ncbi:N/A [soil metagenome]
MNKGSILVRAKGVVGLLVEAARRFGDLEVFRMGAALSYYTVFSLAPLFVVMIGLLGIYIDEAAIRETLLTETQALVGADGAELVNSMIDAALLTPSEGLGALMIGFVGLLIGATTVMVHLQGVLNTIWGISPPEPGSIWVTVRRFVLNRLFKLIVLVGVGGLLVVSLLASAALGIAQRYFVDYLPLTGLTMRLLGLGVSFVLTTVLFGMLYRVLPDARIAWRDVWVGAIVTTLLFVLGQQLIGLYLGNTTLASAYGAAGSFAILLVWVYYSAQIVLFGALITAVYAERYGSGVKRERFAWKRARTLFKRRVKAAPPEGLEAASPEPKEDS